MGSCSSTHEYDLQTLSSPSQIISIPLIKIMDAYYQYMKRGEKDYCTGIYNINKNLIESNNYSDKTRYLICKKSIIEDGFGKFYTHGRINVDSDPDFDGDNINSDRDSKYGIINKNDMDKFIIEIDNNKYAIYYHQLKGRVSSIKFVVRMSDNYFLAMEEVDYYYLECRLYYIDDEILKKSDVKLNCDSHITLHYFGYIFGTFYIPSLGMLVDTPYYIYIIRTKDTNSDKKASINTSNKKRVKVKLQAYKFTKPHFKSIALYRSGILKIIELRNDSWDYELLQYANLRLLPFIGNKYLIKVVYDYFYVCYNDYVLMVNDRLKFTS